MDIFNTYANTNGKKLDETISSKKIIDELSWKKNKIKDYKYIINNACNFGHIDVLDYLINNKII
jgi:polysaccharide deacetylase 2 family uncharacterized protein YibQ